MIDYETVGLLLVRAMSAASRARRLEWMLLHSAPLRALAAPLLAGPHRAQHHAGHVSASQPRSLRSSAGTRTGRLWAHLRGRERAGAEQVSGGRKRACAFDPRARAPPPRPDVARRCTPVTSLEHLSPRATLAAGSAWARWWGPHAGVKRARAFAPTSEHLLDVLASSSPRRLAAL